MVVSLSTAVYCFPLWEGHIEIVSDSFSGFSGDCVLSKDWCAPSSTHSLLRLFHPTELIQAGQIPLLFRPTSELSCWVQYATRFPGNTSPVGHQAQPRRSLSKQTKMYDSSKSVRAGSLVTIMSCWITAKTYLLYGIILPTQVRYLCASMCTYYIYLLYALQHKMYLLSKNQCPAIKAQQC